MGQTGIISKVYPDGDLRVDLDSRTWTFNPMCVTLVTSNTEYNNTMRANERQEPTGNFWNLLNSVYYLIFFLKKHAIFYIFNCTPNSSYFYSNVSK